MQYNTKGSDEVQLHSSLSVESVVQSWEETTTGTVTHVGVPVWKK